ncbi:MAG: hypothetical protein EBT42_08520 [Actinobacteria bacterium]|nr:hypothetical protein [Actinomycetota bacterium]
MSDARIEAYSRALFEVAQAEGNLQIVEDELFRMARAIEANEKLRSTLHQVSNNAKSQKCEAQLHCLTIRRSVSPKR